VGVGNPVIVSGLLWDCFATVFLLVFVGVVFAVIFVDVLAVVGAFVVG
jgi:hypothetical protein